MHECHNSCSIVFSTVQLRIYLCKPATALIVVVNYAHLIGAIHVCKLTYSNHYTTSNNNFSMVNWVKYVIKWVKYVIVQTWITPNVYSFVIHNLYKICARYPLLDVHRHRVYLSRTIARTNTRLDNPFHTSTCAPTRHIITW